ncbi:MAG: YHS domain-containing protein [Gammaproteobacteria bacterium]|nr:YHS domain-containing protein [Gammaproteobacteria bacterium]MCF6260230.1 YHS domain-containing protein [Gammaproteobacteria bacterium]
MEGLGSFLLFAALFYFMMRFGCGSHMTHGHGGHDHSKGNTSGHDDRTRKYVDPVCDMEVENEQGYGKMYQGILYRFCSRSCLDKFDNEPERYINKQRALMEESHNDH